ncbi:MAG: hypothetical protein IJV93_11395, partial [Lentisphaeria bacterium]|nr:hypothetical protein [Lentisphaeria bacterium]
NAGAAHLLKSITSAPFRSATSAAREGAWGREALNSSFPRHRRAGEITRNPRYDRYPPQYWKAV